MITDAQFDLLANQSLLTLLFSQDEIVRLRPVLEFINFKESQTVTNEGTPCEFVFIPVSGELELQSKVGEQFIPNGLVLPGRAVNPYAFLRDVAYQYSAVSKKETIVCKIPVSLVTERIKAKPELKTYLLSMTESHDIRTIAKEIDSIGCGKDFKINFICALVEKQFRPNEWIVSPDIPVHESIYLLEGQLVQQRFKNSAAHVGQTSVPGRTWACWSHLINKTSPGFILKSVSNTKVFAIKESEIHKLKNRFPEDFALFSESVLSGRNEAVEDIESDEAVDLAKIIEAAPKRRKYFWQSYPHVQQSDFMDCGPACLTMISLYYNHNISIQFWRSQLSTSREGTSLFDLAQTSERCGFTSYSLEIDDLQNLDAGFFPCIALRQYHYLVVYKVTSEHLIVGDPAIGVRKISWPEFNDGFEKVVLFLKPTEGFFKLPESKSSYSHYLQLLKGLEKELALSFLTSFLIVLLGLFTPVISQVFMDDILVRKDFDLLKIALAGAAIVTLLNGFLHYTRTYYTNFLAAKFDFRAHSTFIKKMLSLNYKYFADRHVGDFTRRLSELEKVKHFMLTSVEKVIISLLSLTLYSAVLVFYSHEVAIAVFTATPVFFLISWFAGKKLTSLYQIIFKESADLDSAVTDTVKGISTIKSLQAELATRWRYEEKLVAFLKAGRSFVLTSSIISVFAGFYSQFLNFGLMGFASYMAIKGDLTPGQVIAVTMIAGQVLTPLQELAAQFGEIIEMKAIFDRLNDVLLTNSEQANNRGRVKKENLRGEIEFKDVWFRYGGEGSAWVLKGVSFKIEAGQNVALVGPSGSGKSTIAALLMRMFEPTKGQIFIDGRDYLDYDVYWLRSQIGVLEQQSNLFKGSILENIGFSEPTVDIAKANDAAQKAAALQFISEKPDGFGYMIAPGGLGLSGGEKQRIALARTLYAEPKMLVLDEATSALDGIAESELLQNLKQQTNMTKVSIAHRFSTVKFSEFVLVLFNGKVAGFGTHDELADTNSIYQQLFGLHLNLLQNMSSEDEGAA
jgi:ATP-binding cassette subfamily B protein